MPSSEYLRRQADLYWRLSLATTDDELRRIFVERAHQFAARAAMVDIREADEDRSGEEPGEDRASPAGG
jgi:hypothetical protein